jgi:prepilin signal peptidase PulO-like enzyme (type II secretory pathway)
VTPALYPLQVRSWPSPVRGDAPVFWIIERQPVESDPPSSFAILGPYHSEKDAADGLVREVGRRQGFMLIECANCKRVLGAVHCLPQFSRLTSHGTCSSCNAELRTRLGLDPEKEPTDA